MFVIDQRVSSLGAALLAPLVRAQHCAFLTYRFVPKRLGDASIFFTIRLFHLSWMLQPRRSDPTASSTLLAIEISFSCEDFTEEGFFCH